VWVDDKSQYSLLIGQCVRLVVQDIRDLHKALGPKLVPLCAAGGLLLGDEACEEPYGGPAAAEGDVAEVLRAYQGAAEAIGAYTARASSAFGPFRLKLPTAAAASAPAKDAVSADALATKVLLHNSQQSSSTRLCDPNVLMF